VPFNDSNVQSDVSTELHPLIGYAVNDPTPGMNGDSFQCGDKLLTERALLEPGSVLCRDYLSELLAPCPAVSLSVSGRSLKCIVDTGAEASVIPFDVYDSELSSVPLYPIHNAIALKGANDLPIPIAGFVCLPSVMCHGHAITNACFLVRQPSASKSSPVILLGNNIIRKMPESCLLRALTITRDTDECRVNTAMSCPNTSQPEPRHQKWDIVTKGSMLLRPGRVHRVPCKLLGSSGNGGELPFIHWEGKALAITMVGSRPTASNMISGRTNSMGA
jgi:hypothetical protein